MGVPSITNITATSGEFAIPYLETPAITPTFQRWLAPARSFFYYDDQGGKRGFLASFDPLATGVNVVQPDVKNVSFARIVQDQLLVSLRTARGHKSYQLVSIPTDLSDSPTVLLDEPNDEFLNPVVDSSGWIAFLQVPVPEPLPGPQTLHRYHVPSGTLETFPLTSLNIGPVLAWSRTGDLTFSIELGGQLYFVVWPTEPGQDMRLQAIAPNGALLPGR